MQYAYIRVTRDLTDVRFGSRTCFFFKRVSVYTQKKESLTF